MLRHLRAWAVSKLIQSSQQNAVLPITQEDLRGCLSSLPIEEETGATAVVAQPADQVAAGTYDVRQDRLRDSRVKD